MCQVCGCGSSKAATVDGVPVVAPRGSPYQPKGDAGASLMTGWQQLRASVPAGQRSGLEMAEVPAVGNLHPQQPEWAHAPGLSPERMIRIERDILAKNAHYAAQNRAWFNERGVFSLNLMSSPGSGKTTLLVQTLLQIRELRRCAVVEGDQQTAHDALRIRATGVPAIQINTGKGCHLDACMVQAALRQLEADPLELLVIENVGNLVCPAGFDLGEDRRVVILSVTEGEDKPLKYPDMFHAADLMVLNKVDLLPHLAFEVDRCLEYAHRIKPDLPVLQLSATRGDGMEAWIGWLLEGCLKATMRSAAGPLDG